MKTLNKFFYALLALATVGMVACSEDTTTFEPGPQEVEGCYGVYFPDAEACETQGPLGEVSVDPSEATEYVYTAYRTNTEGAITVPVNVALIIHLQKELRYRTPFSMYSVSSGL